MIDTETDDGQCWPASPDTPEGRAQIRSTALDMAMRCGICGEPTADTVERAEQFAAFLAGDDA